MLVFPWEQMLLDKLLCPRTSQDKTGQSRILRVSKTEKGRSKTEKDVLKQENKVLKQENKVLQQEIWSFVQIFFIVQLGK